MKKLFLLFAVSLFTISLSAQGHMTFKGVEINGQLNDVMKQLEAKGFSKGIVEKNVAMMYGQFTGQMVGLGIYTTPITKTVSRIVVIYPNESDTWMAISGQYEGLKERLTSKYGEPAEVIERFESPYSVNSYPLMAFRSEKAEYTTRFKTELGGITLRIMHTNGQTAVVLIYWDKVNEEKMDAELEDEL